jgi:ribosomal protein L11 methyltransferase
MASLCRLHRGGYNIIWLLNPRAVLIGSVVIAPPEVVAPPAAIRSTDSPAFGTGHHATTALCIEALEEALAMAVPESVLDVGTGSGVLALAALALGVAQAVGVDIDADALEVAAQNTRLNNRVDRLQLLLGGPDAVSGAWPLVLANVLAAPLIEMAPVLVRRVGVVAGSFSPASRGLSNQKCGRRMSGAECDISDRRNAPVGLC